MWTLSLIGFVFFMKSYERYWNSSYVLIFYFNELRHLNSKILMWGDDSLVSLLENIFQISAIILLLCSFYYYRHFKKIKRERKLTLFEFSLYIITQVAFFLCAGSYLLLFLDRNYWTNDWNCATKKEGTKRLLIITCYLLFDVF